VSGRTRVSGRGRDAPPRPTGRVSSSARGGAQPADPAADRLARSTDHDERARSAGAHLKSELEARDYGGREFSLRDPEGNIWSVGEYDPNRG
jgi:hypothetical protein